VSYRTARISLKAFLGCALEMSIRPVAQNREIPEPPADRRFLVEVKCIRHVLSPHQQRPGDVRVVVLVFGESETFDRVADIEAAFKG
jgi:hypothetical protein